MTQKDLNRFRKIRKGSERFGKIHSVELSSPQFLVRIIAYRDTSSTFRRFENVMWKSKVQNPKKNLCKSYTDTLDPVKKISTKITEQGIRIGKWNGAIPEHFYKELVIWFVRLNLYCSE